MANELEERRKGSTTCVVNDMTQLLAFQKLRSVQKPDTRRKRVSGVIENGRSNEELEEKGRQGVREGKTRERKEEREGLRRSNLRKVWRQIP